MPQALRLLVLALCLASSPALCPRALAQDAAHREGEESEELRALRLYEEELFARERAIIAPEAGQRVTVGMIPDSLRSDVAIEEAPEGLADASPRDLSWLEGLVMPDIPVRWDDRVIRYLEFFRDDPRGRAHIRSWMRRIDRYGDMVRATLRAEGLPEDLLYIAMIESGFDPRARSDAGAVGMWQFVAATGDEYGLSRSHWVDMRQDPERATVAGARYLRALYDRFGTWELAFAAYNMGYGAMLRTIRRYDSNDYWTLSHLESALPFETSLYVAKVTACAIVGRNLERFGLGDLEREEATEWDEVEVPGGTGIAIIARAAGTSADEIRRLNPALLRDRVPPGDDFAVRIPAGTESAFATRWERLRPRHPAHVGYVVRLGESLADIARRYRTTERELRELNELVDTSELAAGDALMVPAVTPREEATVGDERPVIAIPADTFELGDRRRVFYRATRRDTLAEIARFFSVSVEDLRRWNAIDPRARLQEGMFLQLFVPPSVDLGRAVVLTPDEVRTLVIGSEEFYEHHVAEDGRVRLRYRVRAGDTLSSIGERFGIGVGSLARINMVPRDSVLRVGQEIVVYAEPARVPAEMRAELALREAEHDEEGERVAALSEAHDEPEPSEDDEESREARD